MSISFLLLIVAAICFLLAAVGVGFGELNLVAAGLFVWVLATLIGRGKIQ